MNSTDLFRLSLQTVISHKLRSALTALGLVIGIASVVILTSIGQGIHQFVLSEFTQFGTNILAVFPGKTTTFGLSGATISTVRPLTEADAVSLKKITHVLAVVPVVQGNALVEGGSKQRRANIFGVGSAVPEVWKFNVVNGRFLPDENEGSSRSFAVLGSKLRTELFGTTNPLGQRIRIGTDRFRVLGVMESKGQMLDFDLDDSVYISAGKALALFDRQSLMEIDVLYKSDASVATVENAVMRKLMSRHGSEDFTIITQNQMLETMGSILNILTLSVAALGSISLLVGSVGILTIMTIAVSERVSEIGLLRAVGAERRVIFRMFLAESLMLSAVGGSSGVLLGIASVFLLHTFIPALPVQLAWDYIGAALLVSLVIGVAAGVIPAMKAAALNPLEALRAE